MKGFLAMESHSPLKKMAMKKLCLNVGGLRHEVMADTLKNLPESRLGKFALAATEEEMKDLCDFYVKESNEFFFDRSSKSFDQILTLYRTGKLHMNEDLCVLAFIDDLNYWGIDSTLLEACCNDKFEARKESAIDDLEINNTMDDTRGGTCCFKFWNFLDDPTSSIGARIYFWFSLATVFLSLLVMTLNSFPSLQLKDEHGVVLDNPNLALIEAIIMAVWTLEFILRFSASPNKFQFMKGGVNIIDFLAILPYFLSIIFSYGIPHSIWSLVRLARVLRLARILKLARYSVGVRTFACSLWRSGRELRLVFSLMLMGSLMFGSIVYSVESSERESMDHPHFQNLGQAYYWAIVTMSTLGYGDISPITGLGKFFASLCVIFGILCLALTVPLIIKNFTKLYKNQIKAEKRRDAKKVTKISQTKSMEVFNKSNA